MSAQRVGTLWGASAFLLWGLLPLYWKFLNGVALWDVLWWRAAGAFLCLAVVLKLRGEKLLFSSSREALFHVASALFIGANWLLYIFAVLNNQVLEASLGYYIGPLWSSFMGMVVLKEALRPLQKWAFALACCGVGILLWHHGSIPWVALILAITFASYGFMHKLVSAKPMVSLLWESAFLSVLLMIGLTYVQRSLFFHLTPHTELQWTCLLLAGPLTLLPLFCFGMAAQRLPLSTLAMVQYISPTVQFFLGVFLFKENFSPIEGFVFLLLWVAIFLHTRGTQKHIS